MQKIVLTGGPCGGKSTVLQILAEEFVSSICVVPEVATALFETGYPVPNPWTQDWQDAFQAAIIDGQYRFEAEAEKRAADLGCGVMICDRGLLDGAAYLAGGVQEFCEKFNLDEKKALAEYDMVLHLESLSTLNPDLYLRLVKTNPNRFEPLEMAQARELNLRLAWANHPRRIHLADELSASSARLADLIRQIL